MKTERNQFAESCLLNVPFTFLYRFAVEHGFRGEGTVVDQFRKDKNAPAYFIYDGDADLHDAFIDVVEEEYNCYAFRVCDNCGKIITKGIVAYDYVACSEECVRKLYVKNDWADDEDSADKEFKKDLESAETADGCVYYTEWE